MESVILNHRRRHLTDGFVIGYGTFTEHATEFTRMHGHDEAFFALVTSGKCVENLRSSESSLLPKNTFAYYDAGVEHARSSDAGGYSVFGIGIQPEVLDRVAARPKAGRTYLSGASLSTALRFAREFDQADTSSDLALSGLIFELLAALGRAPATESRPPSWLFRVQQRIIDDNSTASLTALADEVGIDPSYLAKTFRKHFGASLGEYSRTARLERVRAQLIQRDQPIAVLAAEHGFCDESHLSKLFVKAFGITPGQFRNTNRTTEIH